MTAISESARARRYLLGEASEEECAVLEQEYFERQEVLDRIAAAEDELIEDYLAGQLTTADRARFERSYLSAPQHRVRVETVRRLIEQGARASMVGPQRMPAAWPKRIMRSGPWLALAASILVVASVAFWMLPFGGPPADVARNRTTQPAPAPPPERATPAPSTIPSVFALAVSPVAVRGASDSPAAVIPAGTDLVAIRLQRDGENRNITARRASIHTVGGREAWQGPVAAAPEALPGVAASIEVPAAAIPADDYLITLFGSDQRGVETEWAQYFLRVRDR
jgi:hypothetical protein